MKPKLALLAICGLLYNIASAQLTSPENNSEPYIPNWETYEFMKYGTVGASLYTGTVNYSVPIYIYEDNDFNYNVTVDYATNGFRVNHKSGALGHGWSLCSPGIVTREIRGLADESIKTIMSSDGTGCDLQGFDMIPTGEMAGAILVDKDNKAFTALIDRNGASYDSQPDIYKFNFCGFSGSFHRVPSENGKHSFLFFDCSSNSQSLEIKDFSDKDVIVFIDGKGYEYLFSVGEYTKATYSDAIGSIKKNVNRQWNLQKITAPNGRKIEFVYNQICDNGGLDKSDHNVTYTPSLSYEHSGYPMTDHDRSTINIEVYASDAYSTRLNGIKFADGTHVDIEYVDGEPELRYMGFDGKVKDADGDKKRIKSIKVYSPENALFKNASFSYFNVGGNTDKNNKLTFLESIDVSGQGKFHFEYNPMQACPPLGTIKSDHWGYYNGEAGGFNVNNFFENLSYDDKYNETFNPSFHRNPNYQASLSGTLCKITYPTGGFSLISYEQHDCSQKVTRTSESTFLPRLVRLSGNENVGGVRLKQIATFLPDGTPADTVRYEYLMGENAALSSGILINTPRYGIKYIASNKAVERFNLCNSIYDFTQTHIEYSRIREIKSSAGYTDYYYSTYLDHPDDCEIEEDKDNRLRLFGYYPNEAGNLLKVYFNNPNHLVTNLLTPFASAQTKRGLLAKVMKYNSDGTLLSIKSYNYRFPFLKMDTVLTITGEIARDVYYPRYNIELEGVEETLLYDNAAISTKKTSSFNSFGMENKSESTTSDGNVIVDTYSYSGDEKESVGIVKQMQLAHNVNSLLLHEKKAVIDGQEHAISKTRYNYYKPNHGNAVLFNVETVETWSPTGGWTTKATYQHDDSGRMKQYSDSSGVSTAYLWGYKERYPLVIARNATSHQLEQAMQTNGINAADLSASSHYDEGTFNKLLAARNALPLSHVEVFKFTPNFGLNEHTLPNSLKTFYNYDAYGRLTSVADSKRHIMQQGEYNLVSIFPMSATMMCADTYVDENLTSMVTANGGSCTYLYSFNIYDMLDMNLLYEESNESGVINIVPSKKGLPSGQYVVRCEVSDLITGEKALLSQNIYIKPVKLQFSNISDNGNGTLSATIYTDTPTNVTFGLDVVSTSPGTITIAGVSRTIASVKDAEFTVPLAAGDNKVSIRFPSSTAILEAVLWMKGATGGHEIAEPASLGVLL